MAVNSSKTIFTMADKNAEDFNTLKKQIQSVLGSSSWDLEDMCVSSLINRWAKYKPIEVNKVLNINDTDRYNANQGFTVSWIPQTANIPGQLLDAVNNTGPSWTYQTPTTYKRIRDFDGYNHADKTTPFQSLGLPYDGITKAQQGTTSTTHMFFECYWHQRASQIQPKDMALFGDYKNTHYFKMGVVVKDPSRTYAELCLLYNSLNEANAGVASSAVDMPLSVSEDIHYEKKYFKVPNTTSSSTAVWNAILVCVRVNKTTGDIAWLPLPTTIPIRFTVDTATGDVSMYWGTLTTDMKPMVIVSPAETDNGWPMVETIYLTNIFTGLYRFFQSSNLNFTIDYELYYNERPVGSNSITRSTQPLTISGSGNSAMYTYRTAAKKELGTYFPVDSFENLKLYVSVALDNGDANSNPVYFKLNEIKMEGSLMLIPKGTAQRVGYSIQSIMDALGPNNYQIVQSI